MGKLYCLKCTQSAECETFKEADALIDHAGSSKKCAAKREYLRWNGEPLDGDAPAKVKVVVASAPAKATTKSRTR